MSLIGGGSDGGGPPTRKTHIHRIYKNNDPDSGVWVDIERIDELTYTSGVGFAQQEKVWTFNWADFNPDGTGVTKKKVQDPNDTTDPKDPDASVVQVPVRDQIEVTQGANNKYQEYTHFFGNDASNSSRETHSRRVYHYDVPDDQLDENKNPPRDPQRYLDALGDKDASQYLEVEILDSFTTNENENRDSHGNLKPSVWQEKEWVVNSDGDVLLHDRDGDTSNDFATKNPAAGIVDPPWRLDPLQNIVNCQFGGYYLALFAVWSDQIIAGRGSIPPCPPVPAATPPPVVDPIPSSPPIAEVASQLVSASGVKIEFPDSALSSETPTEDAGAKSTKIAKVFDDVYTKEHTQFTYTQGDYSSMKNCPSPIYEVDPNTGEIISVTAGYPTPDAFIPAGEITFKSYTKRAVYRIPTSMFSQKMDITIKMSNLDWENPDTIPSAQKILVSIAATLVPVAGTTIDKSLKGPSRLDPFVQKKKNDFSFTVQLEGTSQNLPLRFQNFPYSIKYPKETIPMIWVPIKLFNPQNFPPPNDRIIVEYVPVGVVPPNKTPDDIADSSPELEGGFQYNNPISGIDTGTPPPPSTLGSQFAAEAT